MPAAILELERVLAATTPPAPEPAVAVICTAVLARWYDAYFQQNRYRFRQRTTVTQHPDDPPADLSTWSLAQILAKIDGLFQTLLSTHGDTTETATRLFARFSELRHDLSRGSQLPPDTARVRRVAPLCLAPMLSHRVPICALNPML